MLTGIASLSVLVLSILLTASLWRQRRVGYIQVSLLGVMFTVIYLYSATVRHDSVYKEYEASALAALAAYAVAAAFAVAEYRAKIIAWISRLWIRRAQTQKISALVKISEARLNLPEQARGPREGHLDSDDA